MKCLLYAALAIAVWELGRKLLRLAFTHVFERPEW